MSDQNTQEQSYGFPTSASVSSIPTLFETLKTIWHTPNLMLIASTNCLEWTDIYLFIHCATLFSSVFAPQELQDKMAIIFAILMWIVRSLGAICFGLFADIKGRKIPLLTTAFAVLILTVILTVCPTYAQGGLWAFSFFIMIRIILSFVLSGESDLATVYAFESSKRYEDTILTIGIVHIGGAVAGVFILSISALLLSLGEKISAEYTVRILMGFLIIAFGVLLKNRTSLQESRMFLSERDHAEDKDSFETPKKFIHLIKNKKIFKEWIVFCFLSSFYSVSFIISYIYSQNILSEKVGYSTSQIFSHNLVVVIFEILMHLTLAVFIFYLENNKIITRKKSILYLVSTIPLIGGIIIYSQIISNNFNPFFFGIGQVMILYMAETILSGQFLLMFPTIARARLATSTCALSRVLNFLISIILLEFVKDNWGENYLLVFFGALAVHITCIYLSREPTAEEKSTVFNGHYLLKKRIPLTKPEDRIINGF